MQLVCLAGLLLAGVVLQTGAFQSVSRGTSPLNFRLQLQASTHFDGLTRVELQSVAKSKGVKANLASAEIIRQLLALPSLAAGKAEAVPAVVATAKTKPAAVVATATAKTKPAAVVATATAKTKPAAVVANKLLAKKRPERELVIEDEDEDETKPSVGQPQPQKEAVLWRSDDYDSPQLETWWKELSKALMTVGARGVSDSHANSLCDLLKQHERVRIKLATDKVDAVALAKTLIGSKQLLGNVELLLVKSRGLLIGRAVGSKAWPALKPARSKSSANSQEICYGCGQAGHHRIECPNKKRADFVSSGIHPEAERLLAEIAERKEAKEKVSKKAAASPVGRKSVGTSKRAI